MSNFNTNNPFRKRLSLSPALPTPPNFQTHQELSSSIFDAHGDPALAPENEVSRAPDHPETSVQKKKPVKRVRLQTPPPLSPDSPESSSTDDESDDPFESQGVNHVYISTNTRSEEPPTSGPPPNPFAKTLQDMEHPSKEEEAPRTPTSRASLDVNAFKRLLLTGYSGLDRQDPASESAPAALSPRNSQAASAPPKPPPSRLPALQPPVPDVLNSASTTDASRQSSLFDAPSESPTATTAHDIEEEGPLAASLAPTRKKQPPPAPTSRRGKLIKMELGKKDAAPKAADDKGSDSTAEDDDGASGPALHRSPSDVNKPLPPSPITRTVDDSPFDREAAGKLPEPREKDIHLAMLTSIDAPSQAQPQPQPAPTKKPVAPPPRRHGRGESKASIPVISSRQPSGEHAAEDATLYTIGRSSIESTRSSRAPAPAPPPPRRPNHTPRLSASGAPLVSPSTTVHPSSPAGGIGSQLASPSVASSVSLPSPHAHPAAEETASLRSVSTVDTPSVPPHSSSHAVSPTRATTFPLSPSSSQPTLTSPLAGEKKDPMVAKLSPPPLPPTRRPSSRRPHSVSGFDIGSPPAPRKVSREGAPPPPPPRARNRGDSKGSEMGIGRRTSLDLKAAVLEEGPEVQVSDSQATHILADLDALQREVDALRGTLGQT